MLLTDLPAHCGREAPNRPSSESGEGLLSVLQEREKSARRHFEGGTGTGVAASDVTTVSLLHISSTFLRNPQRVALPRHDRLALSGDRAAATLLHTSSRDARTVSISVGENGMYCLK
jgi:hypothetical protein